jgi:hypothetical protein
VTEDRFGSFLGRVKEATGVAVAKTREGIEIVQTKQAINEIYTELGRKVVELAEKGELSHPAIAAEVADVARLKAELAQLRAQGQEPKTPESPVGEPAAQPDQPAPTEPPAST